MSKQGTVEIGACVCGLHEFKHIETIYKYAQERFSASYLRIDRFYCCKCLMEREISKFEEGSSCPDWYPRGEV